MSDESPQEELDRLFKLVAGPEIDWLKARDAAALCYGAMKQQWADLIRDPSSTSEARTIAGISAYSFHLEHMICQAALELQHGLGKCEMAIKQMGRG